MAEMTVAQAIKVLHNNQYQKHIGNGEYDYIHPLTDAEAKLIEKLIEQQAREIAKKDRMLRRATTELDNAGYCAIGGGMPDDMQHCDNAGGNYSCADCWLAWLEKEAEGVE